MRATARMLAVVGVLFGASAAEGQSAVAVGGDFQLSSLPARYPSASALNDGGFVVVWQSTAGSSTFTPNIWGRRFDAGGMAMGGELQVTTSTTDGQYLPSVAALADGFVVVWQSRFIDGNILGRRFDAAGSAVGEQFQVSSSAQLIQRQPSVAGLADGGFVTLWFGTGSAGSDSSGNSIQARLQAADGTPMGPQFQVNSYTLGNQAYGAVAALADGGFVATWTSYGSSGSDDAGNSVQGQRYGAGGIPLGGQFQVNTYTPGEQWFPSVAPLSDGGFIVTWITTPGEFDPPSPAMSDIKGRRYLAGGPAAGGEFQVNTYTPGYQLLPSVSALSDGGFVVAWQSTTSSGSDTSEGSVQARLFAAGGVAVGGDFQVNAVTASGQLDSQVAPLADGGFEVVWESRPDGGNLLQGRRYAAPRYALAGFGGDCLDVEGADPADGTPVNLHRCTGSDNQIWRLALTSVPQRVVGLGGKCLLPGPVGGGGDVRAVIGECGGPGDLWRLEAPGSPTPGHAEPALLIHADSGLCLTGEGVVGEDARPAILSGCRGSADQLWRLAAEVCTRDYFGTCLGSERFRIDLDWRGFDGTSGSGQAVPRVGSRDSGLLWFFDADNWEMLIKVLDGCGINDRLWVFAAAATNVEYTLRVTDTALGIVSEYHNDLGSAAAAITDTDAFATCSAAAASGGQLPAVMKAEPVQSGSLPADLESACVPSPTQLCLSDSRFSVEATWRDYAGNTGAARVVDAGTPDSGLLWFFGAQNWEMLVKVLDGCAINGSYWLLTAATTDVEYTLRVTDTETGVFRQYTNPLGTAAPALVDTFETCP